MITFLAITHILIALFLIFFVLIQDSKGGAMGMLGGGNSNTVFGSTGAANFLVKLTRWIAILFAMSCLLLSYLSSKHEKSVLDNYISAPASTQRSSTPDQTPNQEKATTPGETKAEPKAAAPTKSDPAATTTPPKKETPSSKPKKEANK